MSIRDSTVRLRGEDEDARLPLQSVMDKADVTRFKFPIPSSLSFFAAPPNTRTRLGKGDDGVEKISSRLRMLCKERRNRGCEGKRAEDDKTWSQLVVKKRESEGGGGVTLSSSLQGPNSIENVMP